MANSYHEIERTGNIDGKRVRRYTRKFLVIMDDPAVGPLVVSNVVPYSYYEPYLVAGENDPFAILKNVSVTPLAGELGKWHVTLEYDSEQNEVDRGTAEPGEPGQPPSEPGTGANTQSPIIRPWQVKWGSVKTERPLVQDYRNPNPRDVVNAAGQPFDPPIMVPRNNPTFEITMHLAIAQPHLIRLYMDAVNDAEWLGWPAHTIRCTQYTQTSVYEQNAFFYEYHLAFEGWYEEGKDALGNDVYYGWNPIRVQNKGTMYRKNGTGALLNVTDEKGAPVTTPVPLKVNGDKLAAGGTINYLNFTGYIARDFNAILG